MKYRGRDKNYRKKSRFHGNNCTEIDPSFSEPRYLLQKIALNLLDPNFYGSVRNQLGVLDRIPKVFLLLNYRHV